ncbi:MAG TPA: glycosyltransferase family 4 protein [Gaiellaceae bacterium]
MAPVKALLVLTQPPLPEGGAPGKCALALVRGLQAHGVDVRAIAARQHFAADGDPPADLPVEVVPVPAEQPGWRAQLRRLRRPGGWLAESELHERVREAAREADVVHLEETETAWLDDGIATPSLVHVHYLVRRDRDLGLPWRRQFREVLEYRLAERAARRRHRYLVASSPLVAGTLRREAPHAEVVLAPLGLDPDLYPPAPLDGPPTVGLIGTAAWEPTARSMRRLVGAVWPLVRRRVPDARLLVAGRGVESLGLDGGPGVELLGTVPSAAAFLRSLSVLVFPLERGSGMKVKVLEAIACGLPVVTTPLGAEGIERDGIVVETEDAALAAAAAELLSDDGLRRAAGASCRATFQRLYAPEPATRPLVELYERMAAG